MSLVSNPIKMGVNNEPKTVTFNVLDIGVNKEEDGSVTMIFPDEDGLFLGVYNVPKERIKELAGFLLDLAKED